jgi:hypothetical protein
MKGNNGVVADGDPASWTWAFEPEPTRNWNFIYKGTGAETQETYAKYAELLEIAHAVPVKSEERYMAFAEAEAVLLQHALVRPYYNTGGGYSLYRYNIFECYGQGGQPNHRFEGTRMLAEPMTAEQWQLLYADWAAEKQEAIANR